MKIKFNYRLPPRLLIWVVILLSLILFISAFLEYLSRKRDMIKMLSYQASSIAEIVRSAAANSILGYDNLEAEVSERLISTLYHLSRKDSLFSLLHTQDSLEEITLLGLKNLMLISPNGKVMKSWGECIPRIGEIPGFISFIFGKEEFFPVRLISVNDSEMYLIVAALRQKDGTILLGSLPGERLAYFRRKIGIGSLLNSIGRDTSIVFIAIQDTLGIISASSNVDSLSAIVSDPMLLKSLRQRQFSWRVGTFHKTRVFEVSIPFTVLEADYGLIRIGIDYAPFRKLQLIAIRQTALRLLIVLLFGTLVFFYSLAIQNVQYLNEERKRIEQEVYRLQDDLRRKEKLSAMGQLAAGVAHEIRNPLNAISMVIQRLGRECQAFQEEEKFQLMIKGVRKEITRISEIIQQFLEFARPEPLNLKPTSVNRIVEEVVELYSARAQSKGVEISAHLAPGIEWNLDPEKIKQVLMNLVENALQAVNSKGRIEIKGMVENDHLQLAVIDNGKGIREEDLDKIFNLYYTTRPDGTGLGLAIVYQIISEHRGRIEVNSEPGKGSAFLIVLPKISEA